MKKTILITGAASGFGRGATFELAKLGHSVIAGCQIWPQVTELRQALAQKGLKAKVIKLDVLDEIDRQHALGFDVDVFFNNAGIMESGSMIDIPLSRVRSVFETNVFAALEMAQSFAKKMVARKSGKIVWTSSVAGLVKVPWDGAYAASKHAVEGICSAMREELKPYGVQVATVNPGAFATGFNDTGMESMDQWWGLDERAIDHWQTRPLNKQHDPVEMIDAIVDVLVSDNHRYRTVKPASAEKMAREQQAEEWDIDV
ncbi:SDR family oxidoreductase [Marinobacter arenosus]|uniref:SDR family oxidoreductase n=1 Tax=Marinobacter arenosus TaxID=2856822 RepID=UPI001C4ADB57|nr:SDR family oxidoreductase [Marinobacter arenosus]MBW0147354.1 SDR family oxidoreductase [Marinobacter arenosus]